MESAFYLRKAVTIAVRYSAVRRQVCNYIHNYSISKRELQLIAKTWQQIPSSSIVHVLYMKLKEEVLWGEK